MKLKIILLAMVALIGMANLCLAQSRDPSTGSESSSTGVWPSTSSDDSISPGYGSGDHGNVS